MGLVGELILDGTTFGFVSLGIMMIFAWGRMADLTPDASFAAGAVGAWLATQANAAGLTLLIAGAAAGGLAGAMTYIVTRLGLQQLLASLIVVGVAYSVHWYLLKQPLRVIEGELSIFEGTDLSHDVFISSALAVAVGLGVWFFGGTRAGLLLRAAADNPRSVPNGYRLEAWSGLTFLVVGNALVGVGGALFASRTYFVEINMGAGVLISGLGSFLVGWAFFGFRQSPLAAVAGAFVGALLMRGIMTVSLLAGMQAEWFRAISGLALLLCVLLAQRGSRSPLKGLRL